jgi:hypothetical protein
MATRRCGWCGTILGNAPHVPGNETTGICDGCEARLAAEAALAHALLALRAVTAEVERARATVWPPTPAAPPSLHAVPD